MKTVVENNKYFVTQVNSSKAFNFTSYYHYSGVGVKKAQLNLGVFNKETQELVGVMQWGVSFQESIKLDRYVKEPITTKDYLELNRFCMAESEGENSESQALSLGIKWIKKYRPDIKLLVSYSGRREGKYGYIYQATNWLYIGYFISQAFFILDGQEKHLASLCAKHKKAKTELSLIEYLSTLYHKIEQTWSKQFIYIQLLDKNLTPAEEPKEYPKPTNEYPIVTKQEVLYDDGVTVESDHKEKAEPPHFYYDENELLFTRRTLKRQGVIKDTCFAMYNYKGELEEVFESIDDILKRQCLIPNELQKKIATKKMYMGKYYIRCKDGIVADTIPIPLTAVVGNLAFPKMADLAEYCGVSRQAVSQSKARRSKQINGYKIEWIESKV